MAMNTRRNRTAIRALPCRGDRPRLDIRSHTADRNAVDSKPWRNDCRRPERYRHCADSPVKPAPVGASTASNVSQSRSLTPYRRSENDDRAARSAHPPLRHRRDRQRKLALQEPRLRLPTSSDRCRYWCNCRVGTKDCSFAPLTEPDMRASHPALWIDMSEVQRKLG